MSKIVKMFAEPKMTKKAEGEGILQQILNDPQLMQTIIGGLGGGGLGAVTGAMTAGKGKRMLGGGIGALLGGGAGAAGGRYLYPLLLRQIADARINAQTEENTRDEGADITLAPETKTAPEGPSGGPGGGPQGGPGCSDKGPKGCSSKGPKGGSECDEDEKCAKKAHDGVAPAFDAAERGFMARRRSLKS